MIPHDNEEPLVKLLKDFDNLLEDKQLFSAFRLQNQILQEYSQNPIHATLLDQYSEQFFNLKEDIEQINKLTKWLELDTGWQQQQQSQGMQVRYQQLPNQQRIVARLDTEVRIPLDIFISLINETELYPLWFPFCKSAKTIKQIDKATKVIHMHSSPPIISDRELCIEGWGINNLDYDGTILILSNSIDQNQRLLDRYQADLTVFCTKIQPLALDHHKVSLIICVDLKLSYIPSFLPNFMLRKVMPVIFEKLILNAKNYKGSAWEKKKCESPEFYEWLNRKYLEYSSSFQQSKL